MTRKEIETALLDMGRALKTIVGSYAQNANQVSITIVNDQIGVTACEYHDDGPEIIRREVLDAVAFGDGTLKIDGQYIRPEG